jgi:hypothetical protein
MMTPAATKPFSPPKPLTKCAACGEPLYAGFPMRTVPGGGAMHVGCYVLEMGKRRPARHLELVVDNSVQETWLAEHSGLEPAA